MYLTVGLIQVYVGEPGYEERETLENGLNTAALSGLLVIFKPNTNPFSDSIEVFHI